MSVNARDLLERLEAARTGASAAEPGPAGSNAGGDAAAATGGARPRRFVGSSMREVYGKVRAALGPDALILEQRAEDGRVEVVAALEAPPGTAGPGRSQIVARLREAGLGSALIARLPATLRRAEDVLSAIAASIPCAPPPQPLCGRFRLVGPPGAGKTTALIKLAANRVLRYGRFGTLLIGTDRSRLAGCEQLASSAELLGVDYVECAARALPEVLEKWRHMQLVLIDAAGVRGEAPAAPVAGVQDVLTVPAVWQTGALGRVYRRYQAQPLAGVALTHTDQAETLLEAVTLLCEWQLPLWWIGQGSDLAVELEPATRSAAATSLTTPFDRSSLASIFTR